MDRGATARYGEIGVDLGLSGKLALVTGGSKGIGRACAARLAALQRGDADLAVFGACWAIFLLIGHQHPFRKAIRRPARSKPVKKKPSHRI